MKKEHGEQVFSQTHETIWPSDIFQQGISWVIIACFKAKGQRVQVGVFLVDVFCLGAKLAMDEDCDLEDYHHRIRGHYISEFPMVTA
jgi:hypothetical protein